ncbi:MAG: ribonuclease P protein component [Patescibacteria group bacterium]|nr:ribonuclease P protein component [Patescibacteria group bacterium]
MLSRTNRLTAKEITEIFKTGKVAHTAILSVRFVSTGIGTPKISAISPVKAFKTAVSRNRARRAAYEGLKTIIPKLKVGVMAAVVLKPAVLNSDMDKIRHELEAAFEKAGILR